VIRGPSRDRGAEVMNHEKCKYKLPMLCTTEENKAVSRRKKQTPIVSCCHLVIILI